METQVKEQKKEVNLEQVEKYLESVSKHLFLTENGKFFKVFPVTVKGKLYSVVMEFDGVDSNRVTINDMDYYIRIYGGNAKHVISKMLFPQHSNKKTSIPNFKAMKQKVEEIKSFIEEKFDGTNRNDIESQAEKMLVGLEVKKQ